MSEADTKRFFGDLASNDAMKGEANSQGSLAGIASYAQGKGYDVSEADLSALAAQGKDLSEAELEKLAGGIGISAGCVGCVSSEAQQPQLIV